MRKHVTCALISLLVFSALPLAANANTGGNDGGTGGFPPSTLRETSVIVIPGTRGANDFHNGEHPPPVCAVWDTRLESRTVTTTVTETVDAERPDDLTPEQEAIWDLTGPPQITTTRTVTGTVEELVEFCAAYYECGAERIDDVLTGATVGPSEGAYAEVVNYITALVNGIGPTQFPDWEGADPASVSTTYLESTNLGTQPSQAHMPIMYFCRIGSGGPIELANLDFDPSFGWDTTVQANYDIPGTRLTLTTELIAMLEGRPPEMQTIPPVETGYTFVQLPMWLWLENPLRAAEVSAQNALGTVRLSQLAILEEVDWEIGDSPTQTCSLPEMVPFGDDNRITDPLPPCYHRFTELTDYTMTATARYRLYEQVTYRGTASNGWLGGGWVPHPVQEIVEIENVTPQMVVRQIASLNVAEGLTADEIAALGAS